MDCPDVTMMFVVHNAFRRDLNRMQAAAAQADDPAARTALRAGWATFSRYLTVHHTAEDQMLWPPMRTKLLDRTDETDLLVEMADEHSRLDPVLRELICAEILDVYLEDNVKTRVLRPDGGYERRTVLPGEPRVDAQEIFLQRYQAV